LEQRKRDIRFSFHQSFDIEQGGTYFWMTLILQSSMSCKYNSPDNGMMESFFGILKSEMFYGHEKTFQSIEHLEQAIVDYINYYNNKRIKIKLKGFSPVQYRTKSFA
jgi:transposase InsO family protein